MREAFPWKHHAPVPAAGSRSDPRGQLRQASELDGHQAGAVGPAVAVATCLRGTCDRQQLARAPGSLDRVQRAKPVRTSKPLWNIIIGAAFTRHWRKTLTSLDRFSRRSLAGSSRYRCWADCTTDTSGAPSAIQIRLFTAASAARSAEPCLQGPNEELNLRLGPSDMLTPSINAPQSGLTDLDHHPSTTHSVAHFGSHAIIRDGQQSSLAPLPTKLNWLRCSHPEL